MNADQSVTASGAAQIVTQYGSRPDAPFTTGTLFIKTRNGAGQDTVAYYHQDQLGTPLQATDRQGNVVWSAAYEAFGRATITTASAAADSPAIASDLRLAGQREEAETGLHYNTYRDYDPPTGRYIESDPIGLDGGPNTYLYGNANPLSNIDPTGEVAFAIPVIAAVGEAIGSWALPAAVGTAIAAVMVTPGDTSPSKSRAVPYPDRKRGKYTCICRANKDGRSSDNCSIDNQDFAMGYGEGPTLSDAKRAAEKDAKEKLGAKSTHHIQCRCTAPNGDKVIPHG